MTKSSGQYYEKILLALHCSLRCYILSIKIKDVLNIIFRLKDFEGIVNEM